MCGQHPFLFQHFNIVVIQQLVGFDNALMMPDGVQQKRIPRISGVQFPVASLLQKHLYFLVVQFQTEGQRNHFVPRGVFPAEKNLIHIGFIQVGTAYHIGFGAVLLFQPALQIFRQTVKLVCPSSKKPSAFLTNSICGSAGRSHPIHHP